MMENITGWSRSDVVAYSNLLGLETTFDGIGYVKKSSIKEGTIIKSKDVLEIKLSKKF